MDKLANKPQGSSRPCPLSTVHKHPFLYGLWGFSLAVSSTFPAEPPPQPCIRLSHIVSHQRLGRRKALQDRLGDPYPSYSRGCESTVVTDPAIHTWLCGCGAGFQELPLWMAEVAVALVELQGGAGWGADGQEGLKGQVGGHLRALVQHRPSRGGPGWQPRSSPEAGKKVSWGWGKARCKSVGPGRAPHPGPGQKLLECY